MERKDIRVGMKVKATGKTECPESWPTFCKDNPLKIGTVTGQHFDKLLARWIVKVQCHAGTSAYFFSPEDLEPVHDSPMLEPIWHEPMQELPFDIQKVKPKKELRSIKPITIQNLVKAGACGNKLQEFIRQVITESVTYVYEEIPPDLAQSIVWHLDEDDWLFNHGFIEYEEELRLGDRVRHIGDENATIVIRQEGGVSRFHNFENPMEILAFIDNLPSRLTQRENNVILRTRKGNVCFANDADLESTMKHIKENDKELKDDDEESDCDE